ncbi:MAG: alpha/beta hydrolase [Alistipes sp.]|nr:alpha/beta hydrolase [Alistipes sp.]
MRRLFFTLSLTLIATAMQAQNMTIKLWDNATAPHSNYLTGEKKDEGGVRYSNTTEAVLYIYEAQPERATGQSIVICPGGGYRLVAMGHEGHDFGKWLAENGVTAAVLMYRMPNHRPEVPFEDAAEAVRYMKEEYAPTHGITSVGIMGFSAGGHLAASTAVGALEHNGDTSHRATLRPDFAVLFYPVITGEALHAHKGSFDYLLGADRTAELTAKYSAEKLVSASTPPTFLVCSDDDGGVPPANSTMFYNALKAHGVPASLHILPSGGHGWGFRDSFRYKPQWQSALLDWLGAEK